MPLSITESVLNGIIDATKWMASVSDTHPLVGYGVDVVVIVVLAKLAMKVVWGVWEWGDTYTHYTYLKPFPAWTQSHVPGSLAEDGEGEGKSVRSRSRSRSVSAAPNPPVECRDKATGEVLGHVAAMGKEEVEAAVAASRAAQAEWGRTSFAVRKAALRALLDAIVERQEEICVASSVDSGKTMMEAVFGEILTVVEKLRWTIANGEAALASEKRSPGFMVHKGAHVEYRPLGVIGIICPYNYPFHHIVSPLATALFAGNGAVIKVSEWTTWSLHSCYRDLVLDALASAGVPDGLVQFVTGWGDAGAAVVASDVEKIFFTGSPATGKKVMLGAAQSLKPVILELGGKDPLIICDDADFDLAFNYAMRGVFMSSGQNCIGAERILVHASRYDEFVDRITSEVRCLRVGPPQDGHRGCWDMGPLTFPHQIDIVQELVDDAVASGATLVAGGEPITVEGGEGGIFYPPTVLANVTHAMRIVHEEVFGPVMLIMRFESDEDAVQMANDTKYGLSCSVFSASPTRANRIAGSIHSGMCVVNDYGITYTMQGLPFGGVKISGFGRFNGPEGLREASATVAVVTERWRIPTSLPAPFCYPVQTHAFELVEAAIRMGYSSSSLAKVRGFFDFLSISWTGHQPPTADQTS